jgi:hypothetical protein
VHASIWNMKALLDAAKRFWEEKIDLGGKRFDARQNEKISNLPELSDTEISAIFKRHLANLVARGGRIEREDAYTAVVHFGARPNHILHLLLSVVTFGFWIIVWLFIGLLKKNYRIIYTIDRKGVINEQSSI